MENMHSKIRNKKKFKRMPVHSELNEHDVPSMIKLLHSKRENIVPFVGTSIARREAQKLEESYRILEQEHEHSTHVTAVHFLPSKPTIYDICPLLPIPKSISHVEGFMKHKEVHQMLN